MTSTGIDAASSQANLNFGAVVGAGYSSCYVKLGGDNSGRYVAPHYVAQVDAARAAGLRVGHYWVPNAIQDPTGAADYFVANLRGWAASDFVVLDNESLDGAAHYSDDQAAAWISRVGSSLGIGGVQLKTYLGLSVANSQGWPAMLATGCDVLIAAYSYPPFAYSLTTIPADRNNGHQTGSNVIGGIATDINTWRDAAFNYSTESSAAFVALHNLLEEDDMYTDSDRARDDIAAWQIGRIKAAVDDLAAGRGAVHAKLDVNLWALTDPTAGLRAAVGALAAKPIAPADLAAITAAVQAAEAAEAANPTPTK
jgi:hypothetical protein